MAILFPVIITTEKALENALSEKYGVIYIDELLYTQNTQWLQRCMTRHGYFLAEKKGQHGVFYLSNDGGGAFNAQEIYDPLNIL